MVEITLTYDGDIREFEEAFDSNDENFDINDSIYYLLDYGIEDEVHRHNGIKMKFTTKKKGKNNMYAVVFEAPRDGYTISQMADKALTVGEVKNILDQYDDDDLFILSHDNGYTYGSIKRYPERRIVEEED